jgi:hypothetical protein
MASASYGVSGSIISGRSGMAVPGSSRRAL